MSESLCALAPIAPGREREVEARLGNIPFGQESPFERLGNTHFARFQIVTLVDSAGDQLDATRYLLFAAEFDGELDSYLSALAAELTGQAELIWGQCVGFSETDGLERYLLAHRIEPGYSVLGYEGATVEQIREALELEQRLLDFSIGSRRLTPAELQSRWRQKFEAVMP